MKKFLFLTLFVALAYGESTMDLYQKLDKTRAQNPAQSQTQSTQANKANTNIKPHKAHSLNFYAQLGGGYYMFFEQDCIYTFTYGSNTECRYEEKPKIHALFTPTAGLFYEWHSKRGNGIALGVEYKYATIQNASALQRQFITPAILYSSQHSSFNWRLGLGYDYGLKSSSDTLGVQGIAVIADAHWRLSERNYLGMFYKMGAWWTESQNTMIFNGEQYSIFFTLGLSYRFLII